MLLDTTPANAADLHQVVYLEVGPNVWGKGFSEEEAHRNAGRPRQYIVFKSTDPWVHVDGMGSIVSDRDAQVWEVRRKPATLK